MSVGFLTHDPVAVYPVHEWDGRKEFVVESRGPLGNRALFQCWAFLALSALLFAVGALMFAVEYGERALLCGQQACVAFGRRLRAQSLDGL